ncbi:MAG TPA: Rne/Rng family ribonuclease, partial [Gammaproteobacteria bacterium]
MSEELLINITPQETRVAFVENGMLQEVHIERARRRGLVGNIYRGKVCRVLPGMQAAFVDVGLERTAFLHASDIHCEQDNGDSSERCVEQINNLLREGQEIVVQVAKDPLGSKGARLTTHISIPSRFLVFMPGSKHIGVSQRIESEEERERLKEIIRSCMQDIGESGFILRTAADGANREALEKDVVFLNKLWEEIQERVKNSTGETRLIHEDMPLVMRTMRDLADADIEKIRIDSRETFLKVHRFASKFIPGLAGRIEHYSGERPIFDLYGVDDEIQKALERKVQLKSGGYLIIDQTEAMTTID